MKTYIPNSKWALTGALLFVLGATVSFNPNKDVISSVDLASESADQSVLTAKGYDEVRYIQISDKQVLALKKDTEGKVCTSCADRSVTIENGNIKDLKDLNLKYLQEISKLPTPNKAKDKDEVDADGEEGDKQSGILEDKVLDVCEKKRDDDRMLACLTSKFPDVLKKYAKNISDDEALEFYREHIKPLLKDRAQAYRNAAAKEIKDMTGFTSSNSFGDGDDGEEMVDSQAILSNLEEAIKDLHTKIPSMREKGSSSRRFEDIRKDLVGAQREMIENQTKAVKQAALKAQDAKNTPQFYSALNTYESMRSELPNFIEGMTGTTNEAFRDAVSAKYMSSVQANDLYNTYTLYATGLQKSMDKFHSDWMTSGRIDPNSVNLSGSASAEALRDRINAATRGGVVVGPSNSAISSRVGQATLSSTGDTVVQNADGSYLVIPKSNTGIEFGTVVPLTTQNAQLREQLRVQIGK